MLVILINILRVLFYAINYFFRRERVMNLQESGEMYLEAIYTLIKDRKNVRSIDICEYMGFSKPSVSRAVGLLKNGGFSVVERAEHSDTVAKGCVIYTSPTAGEKLEAGGYISKTENSWILKGENTL